MISRVDLQVGLKFVTTIFGNNIYDPAHCLTVLRVEGSADNLKLLDICVVNVARDRTIIRVRNGYTINKIGYLA